MSETSGLTIDSTGQASTGPISELPLKGYYGGKPTRFSIEYDDHSSTHIGNADGSVDLIVENLIKLMGERTGDSCDAVVAQLGRAQGSGLINPVPEAAGSIPVNLAPALFKAFAQDIVKHANNILFNYTLTRLEYPDDLVEHWLTYLPSEYP